MPIRRRQKKPNADPRQKPNHNHAVVDPMVDPGSPPHRRKARAKADTTRTHHRMVTLAQSSSGGRSASPPQSKTATVMLERLESPVDANGLSSAMRFFNTLVQLSFASVATV